MSIWPLTYRQSIFKRYHTVANISRSFPTRWRQKSTGIDREPNYVTVTRRGWLWRLRYKSRDFSLTYLLSVAKPAACKRPVGHIRTWIVASSYWMAGPAIVRYINNAAATRTLPYRSRPLHSEWTCGTAGWLTPSPQNGRSGAYLCAYVIFITCDRRTSNT